MNIEEVKDSENIEEIEEIDLSDIYCMTSESMMVQNSFQN